MDEQEIHPGTLHVIHWVPALLNISPSLQTAHRLLEEQVWHPETVQFTHPPIVLTKRPSEHSLQ